MEYRTEEYTIKEIQTKFAEKLSLIFFHLGASRALDTGVKMHWWSPNNHCFIVSDHKDNARKNVATFSQERYDPSKSNIEYGKTVTIEDDVVNVDGFSRVIDNTGSESVKKVSINETIGLQREVSYSFSQEYSFSMESETKVSGKYGGAELEQTLKASFGMSFGVDESETETTSITRSVTEDFEVPPGKKEVVIISKERLITETPFKVKGILNFRVHLDFENWANNDYFIKHRRGKKHYAWDSVDDFVRFLRGYDVRYPDMKKWDPPYSGKLAIKWLEDESNRTVEAVGVKRKVVEDNVKVDSDTAV